MAREPVSVGDVVVHTQADRDLAAGHWLLVSSEDADTALDGWRRAGHAALRCGGLFTTVSVPELVVHAAAGTARPESVAAFLRESVDGPVFFDSPSRRYHALVPASTARVWPPLLDTVCTAHGDLVDVPAPGPARPGGCRVTWVVPMDGPGALCSVHGVAAMVAAGHARLGGDDDG
ncbi:hypothetical protein [Streptomyces smyrnaeus]|uniref:hypothetical protein n=1 Tax=Streptomyces smyrnaeus TaxID=1387713 RepID=UPI0036BCBCC3